MYIMPSAMKTIFFLVYSVVMIIPVTLSAAVIAPADWLTLVTREGRISKNVRNMFV